MRPTGRTLPRGWTLRRRLLVVILTLLTVTSLIVGVVSVLALDAFLTDRVDAQLAAAVQRTEVTDGPRGGPTRPGGADDGDRPGPDFLLAPGQAPETVAAVVRDGDVQRSAVLDSAGTPQPLNPDQDTMLLELPADGAPHTVELAGNLGGYRAVAVDGRGTTTVVTALPLQDVRAAVTRLALVISAVTLLGLLLAATAGAFVVRSTLRPLQRVVGTATRVAHLPLHTGEVSLAERVPATDTDPGTEVGQVGAALNQMLGHIEGSLRAREKNETRTRQFVADASHELRTPLAAILGYAELTRRAPHELPPDVVHAMGRVESEARRMSGLVQDLLLLARLDTGPGRRREDVDLRRLLADAVSDAHASGPAHHWSLNLPEDDVTVLGDAGQLHQAVANLLTNARVHTPTGTAVSVSLARSAVSGAPMPEHLTDEAVTAEAVVTVVDAGPGIPAELQPTVFERFARGDSSRSRRAGSTGLGLAIVAAITYAHGGIIGVRSQPGRTAFTVRLPVEGRTPTHLDDGNGDATITRSGTDGQGHP